MLAPLRPGQCVVSWQTQITDTLYDDNVTELGDSELSNDDEDDYDYMESDNGRDEESKDDWS